MTMLTRGTSARHFRHYRDFAGLCHTKAWILWYLKLGGSANAENICSHLLLLAGRVGRRCVRAEQGGRRRIPDASLAGVGVTRRQNIFAVGALQQKRRRLSTG